MGEDASIASIVESEEGATLDALSEIFFALEDANMGTSKVENSTTSVGLSANVAAEMARCSQGWSASVESFAPGCLAQCQQFGICQSVGSVLSVWLRTHNKKKARQAACKNERAFDCLLWSSHRGKCQPLINRAPRYGLPTSASQACPRRLDELPARDAVVPVPEVVAPVLAGDSEGTHSSEQVAERATEDAGIDLIVESEEGATLDALSEIFFALEDANMDTSKVENSTTSVGLSANVAAEMARCSQGWSATVESFAPGCLAQCQQLGICQSVGSVLSVWLRTHNKRKARQAACKNERAFDCCLSFSQTETVQLHWLCPLFEHRGDRRCVVERQECRLRIFAAVHDCIFAALRCSSIIEKFSLASLQCTEHDE